MKVYLNYFKLRFITNIQYRAAAIAGISTQFFFGLVFILVYLAFYQSNSNTNYPMEWNDLVTYLWLQQAFYALIYPNEKDQELLNMIKDGNLAYELIRPQNLFIKFYIKIIAKKIVATMLRFLPIIIIGFLLPYPFKLSLPKSFLSFILFILSLITSCLLISSFNVIIHLITMFTLDSKGIMSIYGVIFEVFSGSTIPLPFFPPLLKKIANILPFRFTGDLPFRVYSGSINITNGIDLLFLSIIWIIISIILGINLSRYALKKAVIQGG